MTRSMLLAGAVALIVSAQPVLAQQQAAQQQPGQNFPEGQEKATVVSICGACHDINRLAAGYTPEGWLSITNMMQNFGAPVPADQWQAVRAYLIRSFPEKPRPEGAIVPG